MPPETGNTPEKSGTRRMGNVEKNDFRRIYLRLTLKIFEILVSLSPKVQPAA